MVNGTSIAGRKRNDGIDFYQTPEWATKEILKRVDFDGTVLEPCSGAGAISKLIPNCISSDIREDENVFGSTGISVFDYVPKSFDNIITNPPYFCAKEVIEKCLDIANKRVVMLLKLSFLESANRYDFFQKYPLKTVYVFCKRVNMYPEGAEIPKNSGTIAYAWFEWEHGYNGKPSIEWIK